MKELKFLTELIATIIYKKPSPEIPEGIEWKQFTNLVLQNGFVTLVYQKLKTISGIPDAVLKLMRRQFEVDYAKAILQDYYSGLIMERFEQNAIKCLPLKGMILKSLYPEFYMRSMSDLDILIDVGKLKETRKIMPEMGFEVWRYDEHHDIYTIPPLVNVELHKMLIVGEMENYFQVGFERARLKEGYAYTYEMSIEDFYIHLLGHMAYHFAWGGVGIRLLLDIRVYLDKYGNVIDYKYVEQELKTVGLYTFACYVEKLSKIWFLGAETNDFYDELGMYIVNSGYLGSKKHRAILEVVKQSDKEGAKSAKWRAVFEAVFLPYKTMAFAYPILKKVPILLPFAWVARWIEVLVKRRHNVSRIKGLLNAKDDEVKRISKLYDELDMKHLL